MGVIFFRKPNRPNRPANPIQPQSVSSSLSVLVLAAVRVVVRRWMDDD